MNLDYTSAVGFEGAAAPLGHKVRHNGARGSMYVSSTGTMSAGRSTAAMRTPPGSGGAASAKKRRANKPPAPTPTTFEASSVDTGGSNTYGVSKSRAAYAPGTPTPLATASVAAYQARGISASITGSVGNSLFTAATGTGRLVVVRLLGVDITLMLASYHTVPDLVALLIKKQKQYIHTNSVLQAHDIIAIINTNTGKILKTGTHRANIDAYLNGSKSSAGYGFDERVGMQHKGGKVSEQCSIGQVLWAVATEEWALFHDWMVSQGRIPTRHGRVMLPSCPSALNPALLKVFIAYHDPQPNIYHLEPGYATTPRVEEMSGDDWLDDYNLSQKFQAATTGANDASGNKTYYAQLQSLRNNHNIAAHTTPNANRTSRNTASSGAVAAAATAASSIAIVDGIVEEEIISPGNTVSLPTPGSSNKDHNNTVQFIPSSSSSPTSSSSPHYRSSLPRTVSFSRDTSATDLDDMVSVASTITASASFSATSGIGAVEAEVNGIATCSAGIYATPLRPILTDTNADVNASASASASPISNEKSTNSFSYNRIHRRSRDAGTSLSPSHPPPPPATTPPFSITPSASASASASASTSASASASVSVSVSAGRVQNLFSGMQTHFKHIRLLLRVYVVSQWISRSACISIHTLFAHQPNPNQPLLLLQHRASLLTYHTNDQNLT